MGVPQTRYSALASVDYLSDGAYQLRVLSGDPGLRSPAGPALDGDGDGVAGGDFIAMTVVDRGSTALAVQLQPASDTGQSQTDGLTHDTTPTYDITVNGPGKIATYFRRPSSNTSTGELVVSAAGTYALASPEMVSRTYQSFVEFIPAIGPRQARTVPVTIDTQAPRVLAAAPYGVGHSSLDHFEVTLTEPIDTSTLATAASVLSPTGTPIQPVKSSPRAATCIACNFRCRYVTAFTNS